MTDKIQKFFDFAAKKVDSEERTYLFTASTEERDREGDIIVQKDWKFDNFLKNPVVLWAHNYHETPIGAVKEINVLDGKFTAKVQFVPEDIDPFAGKVEQLVDKGYLRTVSVGFIAYKRVPLSEEDKKQRPEMSYGWRLSGELLELSIVPVPANPGALRERGFQEVVVRSMDRREPVQDSPILPYKAKDGSPEPRKLRACVAALMGARGGIKMAEDQRQKFLGHLARVAKQSNIDLPETWIMDAAELKEKFADIWHEELLDVIELSHSEEAPDGSLIKGAAKEKLMAAKKAIQDVLDLEEKEEESGEDKKTAQDLAEGLIKNLADLNASLK